MLIMFFSLQKYLILAYFEARSVKVANQEGNSICLTPLDFSVSGTFSKGFCTDFASHVFDPPDFSKNFGSGGSNRLNYPDGTQKG